MNRESINWWLTLLANFGVLAGLVFVGLEIRLNTSQMRTEGARALTEMVNDVNATVSTNPVLADIITRGQQNLASLDPVEREQFNRFQFSRLNIAEYVLDLKQEGVSDFNFVYLDVVISDFTTAPGLRQFALETEKNYSGSRELMDYLLGNQAWEQAP